MNRDNLLKKFDKFKHLSQEETGNGTVLIGNPYKNKPYWWLIKIYSPIAQDNFEEMFSKFTIPREYESFLKNCSNGLDLFLGTLSIFGYRANFSRTPSEAVQQPFDLLTPNIKERPKNAKETYFFFGSYNWDGSQLYIDTANNHVYLAKRYTLEMIYEWSSFEEFINTEIPRICSLFDDNGEEINPDESTLPSY